MNKILYISFISIMFLCVLSPVVYSGDHQSDISSKKNDVGGVLVLSSYNPDIRRMSSFISEFEQSLVARSSDYEVYVEDLNFKGVDEASLWKDNLKKTLNKYSKSNLKAIVLLGQEAWSTYLSIGEYPYKIPFFGSIASEHGVFINADSLKGTPQTVDFRKIADSLGCAGGALNRYDFQKNIKLIKTIYQNVNNIAFISDNTYGGIALQSLFISEMNKDTELKYTLLDARDGVKEVEKRITELSKNSVIILGTWRTGDKGQYLMWSSLERIISLTERPVFTISGVGLGSLSVGGAIPQYDNHAKGIADQIIDFYNGNKGAVKFIDPKSEFRFDNGKLQKYGIKHYQLPVDSVIEDRLQDKLDDYIQYIYIGSLVLAVLVLITVFIFFMYVINKRLKDNLKIREQELILAKEKAEESDALKTAFLANMSHEIRTPLNAIVGFSSIICEEDMSVEERGEYSSIIRTNTDMLLTLINDILDISRLQVTEISFIYEEADVVTLMQDVINTTAHRNIVGLDIILDTSVNTLVLNTDKKRLAQVLINLMTNAYKFTKEGSITMSLVIESGVCVFSVADTGVGIPLEKQTRVFDRFEKIDEFGQGTGLGLAICKQIVTRFGGRIYVDYSYTYGAKVIFTVPM